MCGGKENVTEMSDYESDTSEETDGSCIFCLIATGQDKEAEIMKKSNELVCFKDIYPAAPHHYLVVPIVHIQSCESLHSGHIGLVKQMAEMGRAVLRDQGITDMKDVRIGFHQPPYTSVDHLHLHVLAPTSQISEYLMYKFIPGTYRFITEEFMLKYLQNLAPSATTCEQCMWCFGGCSSKNGLLDHSGDQQIHIYKY